MDRQDIRPGAGSPPVFEQGPIRPPSEARSLLVRVTRNCPWNQCEFCPVYKGEKFSRRPAAEVEDDIRAMAWWREEAVGASWRMGFGGRLDNQSLPAVYQRAADNPYLRSILMWLSGGGRTAFLQDADNLILAPDDLERLLTFLRTTFPEIERITTYSRSRTLAKRTAAELERLRRAGLIRVHVGLESGSDLVLAEVKKGVTAEIHMRAGRAAKAAGLELSEYVMPGLGGKKLWREHALETARVLNAIDPDFIRLRSLGVGERMPIHRRVVAGDFEVGNDEDIAREIRLFIESLEGINSRVVSDHILNLLPEVEGKLPDDRGRMLAAIDAFLALDPEERLVYIVGRRLGLFESPADLADPVQARPARQALQTIREQGADVHEAIQLAVSRFI